MLPMTVRNLDIKHYRITKHIHTYPFNNNEEMMQLVSNYTLDSYATETIKNNKQDNIMTHRQILAFSETKFGFSMWSLNFLRSLTSENILFQLQSKRFSAT